MGLVSRMKAEYRTRSPLQGKTLDVSHAYCLKKRTAAVARWLLFDVLGGTSEGMGEVVV
jgi:hypothetical protein